MQEGRYCTGNEGECVIFYVQENPEGGGIFTFMPRVPAIALLFDYVDPFDKGGVLYVNKESYKNFVDNVIDKNVQWNSVVNGIDDMGNHDEQNIPGLWFSTPKKGRGVIGRTYTKPTCTLGGLGGSSRKSKRIHRKPTKRRRNRRRNRKTKKI
jgi:hypothetical protein